MKYHWGKLPVVTRFMHISTIACFLGLVLTPVLMALFIDVGELLLPGNWMISVTGIFVGGMVLPLIVFDVRRYASDNRVRVIFMDHGELSESVEGEYSDLVEAEAEIRRNYEISKIFGAFLIYNERGELLRILPE